MFRLKWEIQSNSALYLLISELNWFISLLSSVLTSLSLSFNDKLKQFSTHLSTSEPNSMAICNQTKTSLGYDRDNNLLYCLPCNRECKVLGESIYGEFLSVVNSREECKHLINFLKESNREDESVLLERLNTLFSQFEAFEWQDKMAESAFKEAQKAYLSKSPAESAPTDLPEEDEKERMKEEREIRLLRRKLNKELVERGGRGDKSSAIDVEHHTLNDFISERSGSEEESVEQMEMDVEPEEADLLIRTLNKEVLMEGTLDYRWLTNTIELNGKWGSEKEEESFKFSYLFTVDQDKVDIPLGSNTIFLCAANMPCLLKTRNAQVFSKILSYLSNEFVGYMKLGDQPVLDRFTLKLTGESMGAKVRGKGENEYGPFDLAGFLAFDSDYVEGSETVEMASFTLKRKYTNYYNK